MSGYVLPLGSSEFQFSQLCFQLMGRSYVSSFPSATGTVTVVFTPDLTFNEQVIFNTIVGIVAGIPNFKNLPNWSGFTDQQAQNFILNNVLPGITTTSDIDAYIAGLPNTIAGLKTGLTQLAYSVLAVRGILVALAKALVYIRNILLNQ